MAVKIIAQLRRGSLLAKVDILSAYCMLPIHPDKHWLLGKEGVFVETALPFGLRSALKLFTAVADDLEWIIQREGVKSVLHYLDDFLLVGPPGSLECAHKLTIPLSNF